MNERADDLGEGIRDITMGALFSRAPDDPASLGAVDSDAAVAENLAELKDSSYGALPAPPASRPSGSAACKQRTRSSAHCSLRVSAPCTRSRAISLHMHAPSRCRRNSPSPEPLISP